MELLIKNKIGIWDGTFIHFIDFSLLELKSLLKILLLANCFAYILSDY